jgi:hypothetical protein
MLCRGDFHNAGKPHLELTVEKVATCCSNRDSDDVGIQEACRKAAQKKRSVCLGI